MSWQGEQGGTAAARLKHNVVMALARNDLYLGDRPTARTEIEQLRPRNLCKGSTTITLYLQY